MNSATSIEWVKAGLTGGADTLVLKDEAGDVIVALSIPGEVINAFIIENAIPDVSVHLDGTLHLEIVEDDGLGISEIAPNISIDELIARDTTPDMLEDEPEAVKLLEAFEARLKRSLALVADARIRVTAVK